MPEQSNTRASHAKILDQALSKLNSGDVKAYWQTLEQISPDYARLAGSVATGTLHGKGARERLQDAGQKTHGTRYTDDEMDTIARNIANADWLARQDKLKIDGDAGLTLGDTAKYHRQVFEDRDLPLGTYTLQPLADAMGTDANAVKDTDPNFIEKNIIKSGKTLPELGLTGLEYLKDTLDAYENEYQPKDEDPLLNGKAPTFGPNADSNEDYDEISKSSEIPGTDNDNPLNKVANPKKGSGLAVEAASNVSVEKMSEPSSDSRQSALKMISEDNENNPRGNIDTMLLKPVGDLTVDEMKALGRESWRLQSNDPKRGEIEEKRRAFYSNTFGDEPAEMDATGRMIDPQPKRELPDKPVPLKTITGEKITDSLQRLATRLAPALDEDGQAGVASAVQLGVNQLGGKLKVDGVAGPKTKAAVTRTLAKHGTAKTEEAVGLGRFQHFAKSQRDTGGAASDLKATVAKTVQPLLGETPKNLAGEALQESLNDLNTKASTEAKQPNPEPLKVDGDIGPKTTDAFRLGLAEHGPEKLTKSYASMLGFG